MVENLSVAKKSAEGILKFCFPRTTVFQLSKIKHFEVKLYRQIAKILCFDLKGIYLFRSEAADRHENSRKKFAHDPECQRLTGNPSAHELLQLPL
ncbi:hypothetical protein [Nitrosococcus wardiae]|uniref:Uncharacterized protein n=1 Tax=Nitrosococcus wardiae TaxID=1814290 RepID=A0A4P7C487_9GAMM|nr:hypothetical protein [Nitrosococcus wardiae]QBQ55652.1 hypothetical protein E3U44_14880 [Nitrosococcus wardiae]